MYLRTAVIISMQNFGHILCPLIYYMYMKKKQNKQSLVTLHYMSLIQTVRAQRCLHYRHTKGIYEVWYLANQTNKQKKEKKKNDLSVTEIF